MNLSFANPAGAWALLGIPAILLIHFLQTKSRRVYISTLFLLEPLAKESTGGRRIERLRNSIPLWLQLLAVLALTWLLVGPRWIRSDSTQSVVVVLDSSIAMRAFQDRLEKTLPARLRELSKAAARTEWVVMESDLTQPALYTGGDVNAMEEALKNWNPHLGFHDITPALRLGQTLLHQHGLLIFVSYHKTELPPGVEQIAVGTPLNNCGFAGFRIEADKTSWHALVKNNGSTPQQRKWWIEIGKQKTDPEQISLQPGQTLTLKGHFPAGAKSCTLVLEGDEFTVDDTLPMVQPAPKRLKVFAAQGNPLADFFTQLTASVGDIDNVAETDSPDLQLVVYDPLLPSIPAGTAIVFLKEPSERDKYLSGSVIAEPDPLTDGLNWQGLICKETLRITKKPGDHVLLWQGDRPLIIERGSTQKQLLFNFDLDQSNAKHLPAFVILLNRFIGNIRSEKIALESANFDTNQPLAVSVNPSGKPVVLRTGENTVDISVPPSQAQTLRAPPVPGFFEITQGSTPLLKAATHFADTRAADLHAAESIDTLQGHAIASLTEKNSRGDFLAPVWVLMVAGMMLMNWAWPGRKS